MAVARVLAVAVSALLIVACGSSTASTAPTDAPTPTTAPTEPSTPSEAPPSEAGAPASLEPGPSLATSGRIVDTANGYAVTLPDGWVRLDLSGEDVDQFLRTGVDAMAPEAAEAFKEQVRAAAAGGIKLFAIDQNEITPEFVTNANVLVIPTGGVSLDLIEPTVVAQLESTLPNINGEIETERVTLPSGEALHISYVVGLEPEGGSPMDVAIHQFLMVGDASGVYLTVSAPPSDELADKALEIAQTFEFVD